MDVKKRRWFLKNVAAFALVLKRLPFSGNY